MCGGGPTKIEQRLFIVECMGVCVVWISVTGLGTFCNVQETLFVIKSSQNIW